MASTDQTPRELAAAYVDLARLKPDLAWGEDFEL